MDHRFHTGSVWELDRDDARPEWAYGDYVAVFASAFVHAFGRVPSHARTAGYLQRYFRFGVVPRWVLLYVREQGHGIAIADLGEAPVDPQIDLLLLFERLRAGRAPGPGAVDVTPRGVLFA